MPFDATHMIWPWLFPFTYLIHIAEEYGGGEGYSAYLSRTKGVELTAARFLLMTGLGLALIIAGILLARMFGFPQLLMVILGTVVLVNGLSHAVSSLLKTSYNPGLVSGVLIWIPLGLITLVQLKDRMSAARFLTAVAIGVSIQAIVSLLSLTGGKLFRGRSKGESPSE
jgi:uncharacterized membrane protein HdeD (DUF308 family)